MRSEQSFPEMIVSTLTLPFRLLYAFAVFMVNAWTTSRNGFAFIRAVPAVLVATFFFGLWWLSNYRFEAYYNQTNARYELSRVDKPDEPEAWAMFAERMLQMKPEDSQGKFKLALAREQMGELRSARNLMMMLAGTEDAPGMANANVWLALDYQNAERQSDLSDAEREANTIEQYSIALQTEPENPLARAGLAEVYERKGDLDTASSHLAELVSGDIRSLIQLKAIPRLIELKQKLGEDAFAEQFAKDSINRVERLALRNPDLYELWFVLVRCATLTDDFEKATELVDTGFQLAKDPQVRENLIRLMADTWIVRADKIESIDNLENYRERLFALCEAIKTDSRSRDAYVRLIEYADPNTMTRERAVWLRDCILGCPNPAVIHVILGIQEINDGDYVQGQKHWKIADQQFDLSQFIVNNLIEHAVSHRAEDFGNLLDMITVAMELFPDQAALYQTRGIYYKNNERFQEAIEDLNYTVERMPKLISARTMLRDCYEAIGDEENTARVNQEIDRMVGDLDEDDRVLAERFLEIQEEQKEESE